MKNQSSLNDIFRFVHLRGGNLLKSYPLKNTNTIQEAKNKAADKKIEIANTFLSNLNFSKDKLILGNEINTALNNYANAPKTEVGDFHSFVFQELSSNYDVDEAFETDLKMLSELVYFSHYSTNDKLSKNNLKLYVAYQILEKAKTSFSFRKFLLFKIRLLNLGNANEPFIKSVGVGDLQIVKQHLLRYETTEIAHIENVMKGETRSREHRFLDRFEETLIYENEKSVEQEKESEATERFEMNRETSKTIQEDQKFSADLSISGTYGPTTIASNLAFSMDTSETTETNSSSEYAKDIMDRSLEKVNERVRTERITKIIKENETKDLHSFTNVSVVGSTEELKQISGVYQFVDKIYKAQVFNYGKRQMFDLMIPEPSSYLHFLNNKDSEVSDFGMKQPPLLKINPFEIDFLNIYKQGRDPRTGEFIDLLHRPNQKNYTNLAKLYQATGIKQPPLIKTVSFSTELPKPNGSTETAREIEDEGIDLSRGWFFYPPSILNIKIPSGYIPIDIDINIQAFSDNSITELSKSLKFLFSFGGSIEKTYQLHSIDSPGFREIMSGEGHYVHTCSDTIKLTNTEGFKRHSLVENNTFNVSYSSRDSANHSITMEINCKPSEEIIKNWQLETYDILQTAYQDRLIEYESKLAQFNADRKAQENFEKNNYGVPPSKQKQVILTELKKHAVAIFTDNYTDNLEYTSDYPLVEVDNENPPRIDRIKAKKQGEFIRFFEQAFEWSQMQYALYPYFWSKKGDWENKFKQDDPNYEYQQFLQASAARLVLSVRPGFEEAVAYYLETGDVWGGEGTPSIQDPLYLSIVDEIREQSGNTEQVPIPDGKPWEVRLPTSLIKLKATDDLPQWEENPIGSWNWENSN